MPEQIAVAVSTEQWGWEYRGRALVVTEQHDAPVPAIAAPAQLAKLEDKRERANRGRTRLGWLAAGSAIATTGAAVLVEPMIALLPGGLTAGLAWLSWGRPMMLRRATFREHADWMAKCEGAASQFEGDVEGWQRELQDRERLEQTKAAGLQPWVPVGPATKERVDLYGGGVAGWRAALVAMGSSLLGSGGRLTVLDLTQDAVAEPLQAIAEDHGALTRSMMVPDQTPAANLLAELSPEEIGVVVAEALHAAEPDTTESRGVDANLVQHIAERLADGPVTFGRLHTALRVLLRQLVPDQRGDLSRSEYAAVSEVLGEAARRTAEPRLFRLAAAVQRLALVSGEASGDSWAEHDVSLRVVQLSDKQPELSAALLRQVLFQVMARRLQRGELTGLGERVVVIAGADSVPREQLERFDGICRRNSVRLILLFAHLRESAVELLGGGDAVLFMRLGNAKEAEHAATFIGRHHRLVASQFTYSHGSSTSHSTSDSTTRGNSSSSSESAGTQTSDSRQATFGLLFSRRHRSGSKTSGEQHSTSATGGSSWSESLSTSNQSGTNDSFSVAHQRTYEYAVEPTVLQGLSPTAFVLVDPRDPASPRLGDCDPRIGGQ